MSRLLQDLPNRRKSRLVGLLFLAAASFVVAAASTGCSEKTGSAFAPSSVFGGTGGVQVQLHSTDTTVTATQGVPLGRFGGPRPGMEQRKAEWDALSETEKAAKRAEMGGPRPGRGGFGGPRPGMEQRKAEWDALSETEKAAKRAEMGGPRPGRGRHGGPPPRPEDDVAEPAEGEVTGAEEL